MRLSSLICLLTAALPVLGSLKYKGSDWSSIITEERKGRSYSTTSGQTLSAEALLKASGHNILRSRIWVNPSNGDYNLAYNLKLAARAKAAGLMNYLDFHYSDDWADPAHNYAPTQWQSQNLDTLASTVRAYTRDTLDAFVANNFTLELVSIGNEIRAGFLWPVGKQSGSNGGFYQIAKLLTAAAAGVKDSKMYPKPKIMVHLDDGWNWDTQKWWYDNALSNGLSKNDFDVIGISYYPFYNSKATLSSLSYSMSMIKKTYGKELILVETNWPSSCPSPKYQFPSDVTSIPFSPYGQRQWIQEVAKRVESAGGTGLFYW
jgi:arabinogalactan endo-1,4-beta-galactosidase